MKRKLKPVSEHALQGSFDSLREAYEYCKNSGIHSAMIGVAEGRYKVFVGAYEHWKQYFHVAAWVSVVWQWDAPKEGEE